jgi:3-deoxy-D-manno-octulosonate 8-phosphate phosphatase (KDO 8-P phosphatase)
VSISDKASLVRLLLFDVDGVLTDGSILLRADGSETKRFHVRDGAGLVFARRAGLLTGMLSARTAAATAARGAQLDVTVVVQGAGDKLAAYERILRDHGLSDEQVAFMGDDLPDLPVLARAGLTAAPADAVEEVRLRVDWVSAARGGCGAARQLVELVLRAQGRWDGVLRRYSPEGRV